MLAWEETYHACADPAGSAGGFLDAVREEAVAADRTVEDAALALKDRLLAQGAFEDDLERELVEAVLDVPLNVPVREVDPAVLSRNLGLLCGALTGSPGFLLTTEPVPSGPVPVLAVGADRDCAELEALAARVGVAAGCAA